MVTGGGGGGSGAIDGGGGGGGADIFSIDRIDCGWVEEFCLFYVVTSGAMMARRFGWGAAIKLCVCARVWFCGRLSILLQIMYQPRNEGLGFSCD